MENLLARKGGAGMKEKGREGVVDWQQTSRLRQALHSTSRPQSPSGKDLHQVPSLGLFSLTWHEAPDTSRTRNLLFSPLTTCVPLTLEDHGGCGHDNVQCILDHLVQTCSWG